MAIDAGVPRTRRALLAGGIGGLAALIASALGRPLAADASDGEIVRVGANLYGTTSTRISTTSATAITGTSGSGIGLRGNSTSGDGLYGYSDSGYGVRAWSSTGEGVHAVGSTGDGVVGRSGGENRSGVYGESHHAGGYGVFGHNDARGTTGYVGGAYGVRGDGIMTGGVYGHSQGGVGTWGYSVSGYGLRGDSEHCFGVVGVSQSPEWAAIAGQAVGDGTGIVGKSGPGSFPARPAKTGVYGYAVQDSGSRGVTGRSNAGRGVSGIATTGTGVHASTTDPMKGYALRAVGRVKLDHCAGVATIAGGTKSKTVTPGIDLTSTSAVVATLQGSAGGTTTVHRVMVDSANDRFTIHLTASATQAVKVAWHVFG